MDKRENNIFFREGDILQFFIQKTVKLPPDDENYFVLISPYGTKHLLPEKNYVNYSLKTGTYINCRIDKINCSGRMFLEPEHPYYKIGNEYEFTIHKTTTITNSEQKQEKVLLLQDIFGNIIYLNAFFFQNKPNNSKIKCRIERIKKGKLYLLPVDWRVDLSLYKKDHYYDFKVEDVCTLSENEEYYVLSDANGGKHFLRKKYYQSYNIKTGTFIKCRFTGVTNSYGNYLEPEHPYYSIGKSYIFKVSGIDSYVNEKDEKICLIKVYNDSDKEYIVQVSEEKILNTKPGDEIMCMVSDIRNGRLRLELV